MTCWSPHQHSFAPFLLAFVLVATESVGVCISEAQAKSSCSQVFVTSARGRSASSPAAQKQARQQVRERAKRRCQDGRLIYMRKWSYSCRKRRKRTSCTATNAFRCCGARPKAATAAPTRAARLQVKRTTPPPVHQTTKPSQARRAKRIKRHTKRHTSRRRIVALTHTKGRICSHTFEVREHGRGRSMRHARKDARKRTRDAIAKQCNALKVIWMKRWSYRCRSITIRKRRIHTICEAHTAIRCCR